ncbi:MAG TPA: hypothetical protein PLH63_08105 [Candidatus Cloacimonadota bacterium]|nr:hypothetical protein [Candidatus Cloacimonadota bacterium]
MVNLILDININYANLIQLRMRDLHNKIYSVEDDNTRRLYD